MRECQNYDNQYYLGRESRRNYKTNNTMRCKVKKGTITNKVTSNTSILASKTTNIVNTGVISY